MWASTNGGVLMKRVIEDLLFQMLIDQLSVLIYNLTDWINTAPWQVWLA
jgi:hypothetical protein